jgi:hypothetical protein
MPGSDAINATPRTTHGTRRALRRADHPGFLAASAGIDASISNPARCARTRVLHADQQPADIARVSVVTDFRAMAVVESEFAHRFPIGEGRMRQLQYRLVAGEAGWILKFDRMTEF